MGEQHGGNHKSQYYKGLDHDRQIVLWHSRVYCEPNNNSKSLLFRKNNEIYGKSKGKSSEEEMKFYHYVKKVSYLVCNQSSFCFLVQILAVLLVQSVSDIQKST